MLGDWTVIATPNPLAKKFAYHGIEMDLLRIGWAVKASRSRSVRIVPSCIRPPIAAVA